MAPEKPRLCWSRTGDPSNIRGLFLGNMKSSGKRALSTWECSWIEGLAVANTCRSVDLLVHIGGPREAKRRLVASVINSKLLYAAPIWTSALNNHAILKKLFSAQRGVLMRIVSASRTVSTSAAMVLASVPPIDLLAEERKETFQLRKELTCLTNLQEIARTKEAICKDGRRRLIEKWQTRWHGDQSGRWTHRLILELTTWLDRNTVKSAFTWRKRFQDMAALMRT